MAASAPMEAILELQKCTIRFGGLTAVSNLDLRVQKEELVGLIGPNGAGKTTVFNLITGVYQPTEGAILFNGGPLMGRSHITLQLTASPELFKTFVSFRH